MYAYNIIPGTSSPQKKQRKVEKDKRGRGEKVMQKMIESFVKHQSEAEERFQKWEERWQKETELDEKRRQEEREHELIQMLGQMVQPRERPVYPSNPTSYESPSYIHQYDFCIQQS